MGWSQTELFNRDQLVQLQHRLREFVCRQCELLREDMHRQWRRPILERVQAGRCITGLTWDRVQEKLLRLGCEVNESDFREGDRVRLSQGHPFAPVLFSIAHKIVSLAALAVLHEKRILLSGIL